MKTKIKNAENYLYEYDQILWEMNNKMSNKRFTNNITQDFIRCMIPHHKAAISMCENLLKYTDNYPLGQFAYNIINNQKEGIKQLKNITRTTRGYNSLSNDANRYINNYFDITEQMVYDMANSLRTVDIDLNFISEMIPHHQGAILMCENVLNYDIDPRISYFASNTIQIEIEQLRILETLYNNLNKNYNIY